jgi:hypothetical protein
LTSAQGLLSFSFAAANVVQLAQHGAESALFLKCCLLLQRLDCCAHAPMAGSWPVQQRLLAR